MPVVGRKAAKSNLLGNDRFCVYLSEPAARRERGDVRQPPLIDRWLLVLFLWA